MDEKKTGYSGLRIFRSPLFRTIFLALFLLSLLIILLFSTFFSRRVRTNLDQELELRNREILSRDADSLEFSLEWTARSMSQVLWRSEFLHFAVIPGAGSTETESAILTQLKIFSGELSGIDQVWYDVPLRGTAFSDRDAGAVSASDLEFSLRPYSSGQTLWTSEDPGLHTVWTLRDGPEHLLLQTELRLARDTTSRLCALIRKDSLNTDAELRLGETVFLPLGTGTVSAADPAGSVPVTFVSPRTGWEYRRFSPVPDADFYRRSIAASLLPAAPVLLAASFLLCLLITHTVYAPITRLMETVRTDGTTMKAAEPLVLQPLLLDLCHGKELEEEQISRVLAGVNAPFGLHGIFVLVICALKKPEGREVTETEANLYLLAVRKTLQDSSGEESRFTPVNSENLMISGLFSFQEKAIPAAAAFSESLPARLASEFSHLPFRAVTAVSPAFTDLVSLGSVSAALRTSIREQLYRLESEPPRPAILPAEPASTASGPSRQERFLQETIRDFVRKSIEGTPPAADETVSKLLSSDQSGAPVRAASEHLADLLTEQVLLANPGSAAQEQIAAFCAGAKKKAGNSGVSTTPGSGGEPGVLQTLFSETGEVLRSQAGKKQYLHIQNALRCIEENYSDSDLSQNDVCEKIGISTSYLSALFREYKQQTFSSWLSEYRVEQSKLLLSSTEIPVNDIGFSCGFNSSQNYFRVFKKVTGMTPGQYRAFERGKES